MTKTEAIRLLGGTAASAARRIGISPAAVSLWPDELSGATTDRVQAAIARELLPPETLGIPAVAQDQADSRVADLGPGARRQAAGQGA